MNDLNDNYVPFAMGQIVKLLDHALYAELELFEKPNTSGDALMVMNTMINQGIATATATGDYLSELNSQGA